MKILRILAAAALLLAGTYGYAKSLSADEAWNRAFASPMMKARGLSGHSLAYSAEGGEFYAFNLGGDGYIILSGNDAYAPVLARVDSGRFTTPEAMAPAAAEWLRALQRQIAVNVTPDIMNLYQQWTAIEPVMTCQWDQTAPYNNACPVIDGQQCVTGCVATAMAQIVRTNGYYQGQGKMLWSNGSQSVTYDYTAPKFNLATMKDRYSNGDSAEEQEAIADLMLACGVGVSMGYSPTESGAYAKSVPGALEHFGYDMDHTKYYARVSFSTADWERLIYSELELGRPVLYLAQSNYSGHCFVIDGYMPSGMWHVNWGWSGMSDGYFNLLALLPGTAGTGGGTPGDGYNHQQELVKCVPAGAHPGLELPGMAGSLMADGDGTLSVRFTASGVDSDDVTVGALAFDADGNFAGESTFWTGLRFYSLLSMSQSAYSLSIDLPAGNYKLYPAYKATSDDEWHTCSTLAGYGYYVELTVDGSGNLAVANPTGAVSTYDLHLAEVNYALLSAGKASKVSFVVSNEGAIDYVGDVCVSLTSEPDATPTIIEEIEYFTIPGGSNKQWEVEMTLSGVTAGTWYLTFTDPSGNKLAPEAIPVTVDAATTTNYRKWSDTGDVGISNGSTLPAIVYLGRKWPHNPIMTAHKEKKVILDVEFYRPGKNYCDGYFRAISSLQVYDGQGYEPDLSDVTVSGVAMGEYDVLYTDNGEVICQRRRCKVAVEAEGFWWVTDGTGVALAPSPDKAYTGDITVPSSVTISNKSYAVVGIHNDAFRGCTGVTSLTLPASVTAMRSNALAYCTGLKSVRTDSESQIFSLRNHIAPGLNYNVEFYTPASVREAYATALPTNSVYTTITAIGSATTDGNEAQVAVTPADDNVNQNFTITEVSRSGGVAEVSVAGYSEGVLRLSVKPLAVGSQSYVIKSAQPDSPEGLLTVNVTTTGIESVNGDSEVQYYDLRGFRVGSRVPGRFYIEVKR